MKVDRALPGGRWELVRTVMDLECEPVAAKQRRVARALMPLMGDS
jgi:hypothetical protein